jgi:hypothetical protein
LSAGWPTPLSAFSFLITNFSDTSGDMLGAAPRLARAAGSHGLHHVVRS